jgi:hypothetical protein
MLCCALKKIRQFGGGGVKFAVYMTSCCYGVNNFVSPLAIHGNLTCSIFKRTENKGYKDNGIQLNAILHSIGESSIFWLAPRKINMVST